MTKSDSEKELAALHKIRRTDPKRYLAITNEWISNDPGDATAYYRRHQVWMDLAEPRKALDDLNSAIAIQPTPTDFRSRGNVYRHLGEYDKALEDYERAETTDPEKWERDAFPLLYQADVHARLGHEAAALSCCARLPDHFWTPGPNNLPSGGKTEIAQELSRRAAAAKARPAQ
jgi:tetratricopeptide (TPR) repeat protein